ncbi:restriction endonuclease subunit S [Tenacibaculum piscium]|uniref:restriction endonuclease subunit S n=1 Tax=Tenacibaculum piscium TaxID=1458515 RepID=UPI00187B7205|nr:restriction endonuclease subunit S [Tenacibaculum piscium]MBE7690757.1 restriction endonuclease subunit S [Tenacibaculum piscium]
MEIITKNNIKKYSTYKNSGVEWLGEIPEHWDLGRLGSILNPVSSKNHPNKILLSITREKGVIVRDIENEDTNHNFIPDDLTGYKLLKKGQFGMNKMKAWQGSYGVSDYTGIVSPAYYTFEFTKDIEPKFFHIAIRSKLYVSFFGKASDGVRIGQWDLSKDRMKRIPLAIPPLSEQTKIAEFLDDKTKKIDEAIAIKTQQINLLKERKQILIHKAVTRGLDTNVKLKNSGVEWIGEIPVHWEVKKVTHLFNKIGSGTTPTSGDNKYYDGKFNFLQTGDLNDGKITKTKRTLKERAFKDFSSLKIYPKGSLVMAMYGATIGKLGILNIESATNQACCIFIKSKKIETNYFFQVLLAFRTEIISFGYGGGQPNISQDLIKSLRFPIAPLSEQKEISSYIEKSSEKIAKAIGLKSEEISTLKEYKSSLINSVVTGKVRVC